MKKSHALSCQSENQKQLTIENGQLTIRMEILSS